MSFLFAKGVESSAKSVNSIFYEIFYGILIKNRQGKPIRGQRRN